VAGAVDAAWFNQVQVVYCAMANWQYHFHVHIYAIIQTQNIYLHIHLWTRTVLLCILLLHV
jgi:hypothetical protein